MKIAASSTVLTCEYYSPHPDDTILADVTVRELAATGERVSEVVVRIGADGRLSFPYGCELPAEKMLKIQAYAIDLYLEYPHG